jgi:hypothetical protein
MTLMQGGDINDWFWIEIAVVVVLVVATWLMVVAGRDISPAEQKRREKQIVHYGDLSEDRAPIPKFIRWTWVSVAIWIVCYLLWTGIKGLI